MLVSDLKRRLEKYNNDDMIVISSKDGGWSNIEQVFKVGASEVYIEMEDSPIFCNN